MIESWHVTIATVGRRDVFDRVDNAHAAARALLRRLGTVLLLFYLGGDHAHLTIAGDRRSVARRVAFARRELEEVLGCELYEPRIRPVRGREHMQELVGYTLSQARHHGFAHDDALWPCSSFPLIVGAAFSPHWDAPLGSVLSQVSAHRAFTAVGFEAFEVEPADIAALREAGPRRIVRAAEFATHSPNGLRGADRLTQIARGAAARLLAEAGYSSALIAKELGVSAPAARRLTLRTPDARAVAAICRRIGLEDEVARQRGPAVPRRRSATPCRRTASRAPFRLAGPSRLAVRGSIERGDTLCRAPRAIAASTMPASTTRA